MSDDPRTRLRENATEVATMGVTGLWLALLFLPGGDGLWLPVLLFGYVAVVPLVALLFGDEADRREWWDGWWSTSSSTEEAQSDADAASSTPTDGRDALETLRDRYAAGELTDDQFERKLDRLLETETLEDAERWRRGSARRDRGVDRELERDP
ncbi:SHOCT domain-containing protein [Natronococcus jeotgali]|uniref:SHOCT domain-containing protein n=1 Tax=Natronococcus jeotgali DSM 18795 TaxID=1227498 RepID=L9X7W7_9EURY|nr:SHOCT domain-containing protein [Natronococcus jeotgali]ELY57830.1 hypothetical protein C492_12949 [Natronococcus jeotgali DSM 18795]